MAAKARGLGMCELIEVGGHVLFTDPTYSNGVFTLGIPESNTFAAWYFLFRQSIVLLKGKLIVMTKSRLDTSL